MTNRENPIHRIKSYLGSGSKSKWYGSETLVLKATKMFYFQGMRHSLPNSRIMVHQPSGGAQGQATDILIQVGYILIIIII